MDNETRELLEKNLALSEENNRLLRSIRNSNRINALFKFIYIFVIVGGGFWAYQYLQPYLDQAKSSYESLSNTQADLKNSLNKYLPK